MFVSRCVSECDGSMEKKKTFITYENVLCGCLSRGGFQEQRLHMKAFIKESGVSSSSCALLFWHGFSDSCGVSLLFCLPVSACLTVAFFFIRRGHDYVIHIGSIYLSTYLEQYGLTVVISSLV